MIFDEARRFGVLLAGGRVRRMLLLAGLVFAAVPVGSALATTTTFSTQGCGNTVAANLFTLPVGVSSVSITATGSAGQSVNAGAAPGGSGDVVSGTLSGLSAGQVLDVCVNSGGGAAGTGANSGFSGGAGGGASGVALGGDFSTPVLIGGGGGGGGFFEKNGGGAGLPSGSQGGSVDPLDGGTGGGGGNNTTMMVGAGGAPQSFCDPCVIGSDGAASSSAGPGAGGAGGNGNKGAGGGGAGYFGGGGGGGAVTDSAGGGGGGSDFCASSLAAPASLSGCGVTGPNTTFGTASVVLTYTSPSDLAATLVNHSTGVGPGTALADKAKAIQTAVNAGQTATACAGISDYLGLVKAQTKKKLTASQAAQLTTDANNLAAALGCS